MGSVYTAVQDPIDRQVAIKVLRSALAGDELAVRRFEQEARAISKMQHPNTVAIHDFGRTDIGGDECLYIVMEYLRGRTLTRVLRAEGVLAPFRVCRIMRQVCASVADAHDAGIIHRDLKPDNIFLTEVGSDKDWVKVLDFGVAKLVDAEGVGTLTETGMIFGTPKYMSPEQADGRPIDHRADIYAIGVVLYELLLGKPPFTADTPVGVLMKHISEPPKPFTEARPDLQVDPSIEALVMRALAKQPDERPQRVVELWLELEGLEGPPTGLTPATGMGTPPTPVRPEFPTEMDPGTIRDPTGTPPPTSPPPAQETRDSVAGTEGGTLVPPGEGEAPVPELQATEFFPGESEPYAEDGPRSPVETTRPSDGIGGGLETLGPDISARWTFPRVRRRRPGFRLAGLVLLGLVLLGLVAVLAGVTAFGDELGLDTVMERAWPAAVRWFGGGDAPVPVTDGSESKAAPNERAAGPAGRARAGRTVVLRFESTPPAAAVRLAGRRLGRTPFKKAFARGHTALVFVFEKEGFVPVERTVRPSGDRTLSVMLPRETSGSVREGGDRP